MQNMELDEMERRFKTAIADLDLDKEQAQALGQQLVATVKAAAEQRIAFKSEAAPAADPPPPEPPATETIYYGPGNVPGIIADGQWIALKAAGAPPDLAIDAGAPPIEAKADDMVEAIADEVVDVPEEVDGDFAGDMSRDELRAMLKTEVLEPLIKALDITGQMNEFKSMFTGTATKEAGELTRLKTQYQQLANQIAQIEGRQPATILPAEVEAAFKSAGPAQPPSPEDAELAEVVNDPTRPFASIAARTMPALYKTNSDGGFAGWTPPPPV